MVGKPSILQRARNAVWGATHSDAQSPADGMTSVNDLEPWNYAGQSQFAPFENSLYDGGKFAGGFGPTQIQQVITGRFAPGRLNFLTRTTTPAAFFAG